jgi:hypothetical protein
VMIKWRKVQKINRKLMPSSEKEIAYLYNSGESGHTLARKFCVDNSTIYDCLKRQKIEIRSTKEAGILASSGGRIAKHSIPISSLDLSPENSKQKRGEFQTLFLSPRMRLKADF